MIDRTAIAGIGGTFATFSLGQLDSLLGVVAGVITIIYMVLKIKKEFTK